MKAKKTALLLIEFQNDFCSESGQLNALVRDEIARGGAIENAVRLLNGARKNGVNIIHCPFILDKKWTLEADCAGLLRNLAEQDAFAPDSWGAEIIDSLKPIEGETILSGKRGLSAFEHTNLERILVDWGIETIGIAGFLTNVCVQASAFGAYDRGYRVQLITDACVAVSTAIQNYVEQEVAPIFGGPFNVSEFLEGLE